MPKKDEKEVIKEEKPQLPEDKYVYSRDHKKSVRQIIAEERQPKEEKQDESVVTPPDKEKEEKKESEKEEVRKVEESKIDPEEITRKAREEAEKVTNEKLEAQRKEFQAKIDEIVNKDKDILERQKEADALVAVWEKENRLPKDWKEIAQETMRINEAKLEQRLKAQEEAQKKADEERKQQEAKTKEDQQKSYQSRIDEINRKVTEELNELYEAKMLKKPADLSKIEAEDMKETNDLVKFGIELNKKRAEQKLTPIDSISKIYFMHYKPFIEAQGKKSNQPAGADAPVSGAKVTQVTQQPKGYVYARDHNKTFRQILVEGSRKTS